MVRKKRPNIQGHNPDYSTNFTSPRETGSSFAAGASERAAPPPEPATPAPVDTDSAAHKPAPTNPESSEKAKDAIPPKVKPETVNPRPKVKVEIKRETRLDAAVTIEQSKKLAALEGQGVSTRDVIVLAGRRATARFELKPQFIEKPEANRLPMRDGYHTTKRLPANVLDDLREKHDPLRLQSDTAMVRGQFEPLFWTCLDEVIEELRQKTR
ncbi:MAG: hypothetical protein HEP70_20100 [Rhodobiaceae bacterium]|uniref:Uncharacterized protein n=1 Tax=Phaeobacter piscinae TaxID=1580596 RepID=A0ABM6PJX9_9RHOB|nr:hypothetical protein [Phaeobacter piscinae]ATG37973.1 hypothetical protein PhaeoP36_03897 [Phaeobacter piscinae]AUQ88494.1 hypothetical protein PhaeoP42_03898 [Phaeobacter piscinae]MCE8001138.1 hypothetical protein [Rhodobiaceae bacterium]